jgi:hypothetical protein
MRVEEQYDRMTGRDRDRVRDGIKVGAALRTQSRQSAVLFEYDIEGCSVMQ